MPAPLLPPLTLTITTACLHPRYITAPNLDGGVSYNVAWSSAYCHPNSNFFLGEDNSMVAPHVRYYAHPRAVRR